MSGAVAAARREAEEALAEYDRLWGAAHATNAYGRAVVGLASALRALLAAGPEAPPPPSDAVREAAERLRAHLGVTSGKILYRHKSGTMHRQLDELPYGVAVAELCDEDGITFAGSEVIEFALLVLLALDAAKEPK